MKNGNKPAFPASESWNDEMPDSIQVSQEGVTKRELFAAMAMQGLVANAKAADLVKENALEEAQLIIAQASVVLADALLKALDKIEAHP